MENIELWVTEIKGTFTVLDRWAFSFEGENPVINYFSNNCYKTTPEELKHKIKGYITEKYKKCGPTIDVNNIYKNIIKNIDNAKLVFI
ncbi:hypothetical protein COU58_02205 [Candidatus Pacearchaeota archaeon CG10_big_fil_rev_8_21_14_0_10_32_42]|nr:MAG: hypothetical protein COU58_02205 [Candidatus Pacearchaeota archaeon CG10_big_fil_rev_8_21_14_0_10_32_42]